MPVFIDQLGRNISLKDFPQRIISLVPSQTELLFDLGLDEQVVGITKFCVHPEKWFRNKTRVGGTKQINFKTIAELDPDLIIANKEENTKEQIDELAGSFPVWVSDISTLNDALEMIGSVGQITNREGGAKKIIAEIKDNFSSFTKQQDANNIRRTAYLIWQDPYMSVGRDTFIHQMMTCCGMKNIFEDRVRYPTITEADLSRENCELLLLSSEPFPFKENHLKELQNKLQKVKIILVDGEMFSWYGSRLIKAPQYFRQLMTEIGK